MWDGTDFKNEALFAEDLDPEIQVGLGAGLELDDVILPVRGMNLRIGMLVVDARTEQTMMAKVGLSRRGAAAGIDQVAAEGIAQPAVHVLAHIHLVAAGQGPLVRRNGK